jgi:hypothetical protein
MPVIKHSTPTFIVNKVKGWNTRLIYAYYGIIGSTFDYVSESGGNLTLNLFSVIANSSLNASNGSIYKGQYSNLGPRYFKTGKSLRIKGQFLITGTSSKIFNILSQIDITGGGGTTLISNTNNNHNHTLPSNITDCPVNFELTYNSLESDADPNRTYIQSNGFYQYNAGDYNQNGPNIENNVYVPIYSTNGYISTGEISDSYDLYISFDNSEIDNLKIVYLTIEELQ